MKRTTVLLFLFCFTSFVLFAQKGQKDQKESIVFTALTYDYGTIGIGSPGKCEFKFTNTMRKPLIIYNVKPSCGCTVADWRRRPSCRENRVIKLDYNTKYPEHSTKQYSEFKCNQLNSDHPYKRNVTRYN